MLDQNTDRMWYVIGAMLIGAAIIFGMNTLMPEAFASVGGQIESIINVSSKRVDLITANDNLLMKSMSSYGYHTPPTWTSDDTFGITWNSQGSAYITLRREDKDPLISKPGDYTLSGYIYLNGEPITEDIMVTPNQIATNYSPGTIDPDAKSTIDGDTGYISITQHLRGFSPFTVHTKIKAKEGDVLTFKQLKLESGSKATPYVKPLR